MQTLTWAAVLLLGLAAPAMAAPATGVAAGAAASEAPAVEAPAAPDALPPPAPILADMVQAHAAAEADYRICMANGHIPLRDARTTTARLRALQGRLGRSQAAPARWTPAEARGALDDLDRIRATLTFLCPPVYTPPERPRRPQRARKR
jgi:hypothetical protein